MTIKIVTDSTCDLPKSVVDELDISVVPCYINFSDHSYLDGVDLTRKEFYEKLPKYAVPPTTSAPSISMFMDAYKKSVEKGATEIITIHMSESLSGIFNVAKIAGENFTEAPVHPVDPGQLTLGTGLAVEAAARAAKLGKSAKEIIEMIKDMARRTYTIAALDTVEFLRRSGRVSHLRASVASLLDIKPLMKMNAGKAGMEVTRTTRNAIKRVVAFIREIGNLEQVHLVHTNSPLQAEELRKLVADLIPDGQKVYSQDVTPLIGAHIGPGAVGFVFVTAQ